MKTLKMPAEFVNLFLIVFPNEDCESKHWVKYWHKRIRKSKKCENEYAYEVQVSDRDFKEMNPKSYDYWDYFQWHLKKYL